MQNINKIGEVNYNNKNQKMTIIDYKNYDNIHVKFEDDTIIKCRYGNFINGAIKNPNAKLVQNIGHIGSGKHKCFIDGIQTIQYTKWIGMLTRCNPNEFSNKNISYKICEISKDWHNFQNFGNWFDKNYYTVKDEKMNLDKDLLIKGNKIYSAETCIFLPAQINILLINNKIKRGIYPLGVTYKNDTNKYIARMQRFSKSIYLGSYNTPEKAFEVYKKHKEIHIKEIAELHKQYIPIEAYNALINWQIEITD